VSSPPDGGLAAIVLDIEGTVTPIAFVTGTLFPYARDHLREYLTAHAEDPELLTLLVQLRDEHTRDAAASEVLSQWVDGPRDRALASAASYVEWLMDRDRKSPALKALQGRIWEQGYRSGSLVGDLFPDVPPALRRWRARGLVAAIFSSGSVHAQRLLFGHSSAGDLTPLVAAYFDTTTGPKGDPESYRRIAASIGRSPDVCLFVSDAPVELEAASGAGMQVRLAIRPGNAAVREHRFQAVHTFGDIAR